MATDPADRTVIRAACPHDCPDTCAMLVTTELRNGKRVATEIAGDPAHPTTAGKLCTKVARYLERVYHPDRLLYPLKRVGAKGQGRFERVSWDEALTDIAQRLERIAAVDPQRIVPYSYAGTMGLVHRHGHRAVPEREADRVLGRERHHVEPALVDSRARGEAPRREAHRNRPVPLAHGREVPRARRAATGHGRGARARARARAAA